MPLGSVVHFNSTFYNTNKYAVKQRWQACYYRTWRWNCHEFRVKIKYLNIYFRRHNLKNSLEELASHIYHYVILHLWMEIYYTEVKMQNIVRRMLMKSFKIVVQHRVFKLVASAHPHRTRRFIKKQIWSLILGDRDVSWVCRWPNDTFPENTQVRPCHHRGDRTQICICTHIISIRRKPIKASIHSGS